MSPSFFSWGGDMCTAKKYTFHILFHSSPRTLLPFLFIYTRSSYHSESCLVMFSHCHWTYDIIILLFTPQIFLCTGEKLLYVGERVREIPSTGWVAERVRSACLTWSVSSCSSWGDRKGSKKKDSLIDGLWVCKGSKISKISKKHKKSKPNKGKARKSLWEKISLWLNRFETLNSPHGSRKNPPKFWDRWWFPRQESCWSLPFYPGFFRRNPVFFRKPRLKTLVKQIFPSKFPTSSETTQSNHLVSGPSVSSLRKVSHFASQRVWSPRKWDECRFRVGGEELCCGVEDHFEGKILVLHLLDISIFMEWIF